ncbi:uncharacterized protein BO88DRAFT_450769 [Aspergillus vadensis CBS 113365]|uniref:Extracellular membrane protein CFEM domain-containing protein n=1 Tax=Aspergillus vadensis (strain CBS 113365 / IMI 142717 / IBT 24658) TaxID=1448311 RepID=A0A319C9X2_ASPVC|nr:hypothetical protein BO88DRAFT_450769 [Aspergillus vadensis CBS 113365]PYH72158.1 hypothetical protein BO88DRAFT_450769 [Aspergillus vadensis CBS 113365]
MVRIMTLGLFLISALTAQACTYCQCEFSDSSHCCVYSDASIGELDCTSICAKAHRADGVSNADGTAGTACNAGGKYECISAITAQGRTPCYTE